MKSSALIVVLSAVVLALGYRQYQAERAHREELVSLRAETRAMRARLDSIRPAWVLPRALPAASPPPPVVDAPDNVTEEREPEEPAGEDQQARLEARFASDASDPGWSRPTEETLRAAVVAVLPEGSTIRGLACRSTLCRLGVSHASRYAVDSFTREALRFWRGPVSMTQKHSEDGSIATVVYLTRK